MAPRVKKREPPPTAGRRSVKRRGAGRRPISRRRRNRDSKPSRRARAEHYAEPLLHRIQSLVFAIQNNDESQIEEAILRLSRSRRVFAPLGVRDRRLRAAVRRPAADPLQLAADAGPDHSGDVDLARDVRLQGPPALRQVVPRSERRGAGPDLSVDHRAHGHQLLLQRRLRDGDLEARSPCRSGRPSPTRGGVWRRSSSPEW